MILEAERVLRPEDRQELAGLGVTVLRELGGRRYVVRSSERVTDLRNASGAVSALHEIDADEKIGRSARARLGHGGKPVPLVAIFHDDISFDEARERIISSGARLRNPLQTQFDPVRGIEIVAATREALALSDRDEVFHVTARPRRIQPHNAAAAALSSVTPLYTAPYGLTGEGVDVSIFDVGHPDVDHPELAARIIKQGSGATAQHPTHVAGTIGARGNNGSAKGMAPAVRMFSWEVNDDWPTEKENNLGRLALRADNNSWGYVLGWNFTGSSEWEWFVDTREYFGSYVDVTAAVDKIGNESGTLLVHSSGNDSNDSGPRSAPFAHKHVDEGTDSNTYCYSADGSGNDCVAPCTRCETTRHPADGPFTTIGVTASAKNALSVGAVTGSKNLAGFSSVGPTLDGRVKPDLVAKGVSQFSTIPGTGYGVSQGTSMSAPVVTGIAALLVQQWRLVMSEPNPTPDILKALMINGAEDLGLAGPDFSFGFGLVNAKAAADLIRADGDTGSRIRKGTVSTGTTHEYRVSFQLDVPGRVTINWLDPEGSFTTPDEQPKLVNDLDLKVIDPAGAEIFPFILDAANPTLKATRGVNSRDNVELVEIATPVAGEYRVLVSGRSVPKAPQSFALVSNGVLSAAAAPCTDAFEPNNSSAAAFGRLVAGSTITPVLCPGGDVDFYRFTVDKTGDVIVSVTPAVAVRVTVSSDRGFSNVIEIAAGSTGQVTTTVGSSSVPATFTILVEPVSALTAGAAYSVSVNYPADTPPRRRTPRR